MDCIINLPHVFMDCIIKDKKPLKWRRAKFEIYEVVGPYEVNQKVLYS